VKKNHFSRIFLELKGLKEGKGSWIWIRFNFMKSQEWEKDRFWTIWFGIFSVSNWHLLLICKVFLWTKFIKQNHRVFFWSASGSLIYKFYFSLSFCKVSTIRTWEFLFWDESIAFSLWKQFPKKMTDFL